MQYYWGGCSPKVAVPRQPSFLVNRVVCDLLPSVIVFKCHQGSDSLLLRHTLHTTTTGGIKAGSLSQSNGFATSPVVPIVRALSSSSVEGHVTHDVINYNLMQITQRWSWRACLQSPEEAGGGHLLYPLRQPQNPVPVALFCILAVMPYNDESWRRPQDQPMLHPCNLLFGFEPKDRTEGQKPLM
jgi:hypothetical protein